MPRLFVLLACFVLPWLISGCAENGSPDAELAEDELPEEFDGMPSARQRPDSFMSLTELALVEDDAKLLQEMEHRIQMRRSDRGYDALLEPEKNVLHSVAVADALKAGGYQEVFLIEEADRWQQIEDSLREIAPDTYGLLYEKALLFFPKGHPPASLAERKRFLTENGTMAVNFFATLDAERVKDEAQNKSLREMTADYVRANLGDFAVEEP